MKIFLAFFVLITPFSNARQILVLGNNLIINNESDVSTMMWHESTLDFRQDFKLSFEISMRSDSRSDGIGLAFTSKETAKDRPIGGKNGILGILDIPNTFVLEFDGFYNQAKSNVASQFNGFDDELAEDLDHIGHIAMVDTNSIFYIKDNYQLCQFEISERCIKHKTFIDLNNDSHHFPLVGTKTQDSEFDVELTWDAQNQTMSAMIEWKNVQGSEYFLSHEIDLDYVFDGETEVNWGFSSATSNNKFLSSVNIEQDKLPHQIKMDLDEIKDEFGQLDLSKFKDKELEIEFSVLNSEKTKMSSISYEYQSRIDIHESNWKQKGTDIPLTPIEPGLPVEPDGIQRPPIVEDLPEIEVPVQEPEVEVPVEPKPKPELKPEPKPEPEPETKPEINKPVIELPPRTEKVYSLSVKVDNVTNGSNWIDGKPNLNPKVETSYEKMDASFVLKFDSGDHGLFDNGQKLIEIGVRQGGQLPHIKSNKNYQFVGFYDEDGNIYDANNITSSLFIARYQKVKINFLQWLWWLLALVAGIYLINKRKKSKKNRKEKYLEQ